MLDQILEFAAGVSSDTITITVSKSEETILLSAPRVPGVKFSMQALRNSKGGVLNDMTALEMLNVQLAKR